MSKQVDWPYVINLGNSIIGVSVLAMPFCFKQCGILLGMLLLLSCAYLTQVSCCLLMKGAFTAKRRSYEYLALFAFGPAGKLAVEISLIGLLIGTCIAFHVVIGDLGPAIISRMLAVENSSELRTFVMVFLGLFVALPLGLLRNVESLSNISAISLGFYMVFVTEILSAAFPNIWSGIWVTKVQLWVPEGIFKCIPIFSLAFGCQSQLFIMYDALPEPSIKRMNSISKSAIMMCTTIYLAVGFLGYVAFCDEELSGDILLNFRSTIFSEAVKLGFCLAVAVSFPLVIFPCRAAIHTLLFARAGIHDNFGGVIIPEPLFKLITLSIVLFTLGVGIAIPNIEFILALTGATMGSMICYIFPAVLFINLMSLSKTSSKFSAQVVLFIGVTLLLASTYMTLYDQDRHSRDSVVKIAPPPPLSEKPGGELDKILDKPLDLAQADPGSHNDEDGSKLDTGQEGDDAPKDLDKKIAQEGEDVGNEDYRREPPNPHAPDEAPIKKLPEEKEAPKDKKPEEQEVVKAEESKLQDIVKKSGNDTLIKDDMKESAVKEESKADADVVENKAKEVDEKKSEDEKEIEQKRKEAEADAEEAKGLLKELEKQREEQKALIQEQKQIIENLRQHHIDDHIAEDAKRAAAEDVLGMLQLQGGQQALQQQAGQGLGPQAAGPQGAQQADLQQNAQPGQPGGQPVMQQYAAQQPIQQPAGQQVAGQPPVQQAAGIQGGQQHVGAQGVPPIQQGSLNQPVVQDDQSQKQGVPLVQQNQQQLQQLQILQVQQQQQPVQLQQQQKQPQPAMQQQPVQMQQQQQQQAQPVYQQQQQQQAQPQQQLLQPAGGYQQQGGQQQSLPPAQLPQGHHQESVNQMHVPAVQELPGQGDFAQQHFQQQQHPEQAQQKPNIVPVPQQNLVVEQQQQQQQQQQQEYVQQQVADVAQNELGNNVNPDLDKQPPAETNLNIGNLAAVDNRNQNDPVQLNNMQQAGNNGPPAQNLPDTLKQKSNNENSQPLRDKDPPVRINGKQTFLNVDLTSKDSVRKHMKHKSGGG